MSIVSILPIAFVFVSCGSKSDPPAEGSATAGSAAGSAPARSSAVTTPRGFFSRGIPTYIVGTSGDELSDRVIAGQVDLIRSMLAPDAKRILDTEVPTKGPSGWPANPVIYGGAHVNAAIAALAPALPFAITAGKITIGGQTFEGDGLALITVVPAREGRYPEFLLYAGTGTPGVAEINAGTTRGTEAPIVIADAFGPLVDGTWAIGPDGIAVARLDKPRRRVGWRETVKDVAGAKVAFRFFTGAPAADDDAAIQASTRGIEIAVKKLAVATAGVTMTVYVHPDQRSKQTLTGDGGDGHAVGFARTLHVYYLRPPDRLEPLVAHESTHVLAWQIWPPAGSPLFGEGVAVWVAGGYAGESLAKLRIKLHGMTPAASIRDLLGAKLRAMPEGLGYPIAGVLVEIAIEKVGLANVRDHLYGATTATWDDACKRAGTTAADLDAALAAALK
jgi:hypothetical protein